MTTIKAALHVHSTFSDGELTIPELREVLLAEGFRVVCMADHADGFDDQRVAAYIESCEAASDDQICFVPGLEFGCEERMHIIGYGTTALVNSTDPETVISHINRAEGLSVIAHPQTVHLTRIEGFQTLPKGIEAWNSKYDGRYAPRPAVFDLIERLRKRRPDLLAFYGQDLHWRRQYRGLTNTIELDRVNPGEILAALQLGEFSGHKDGQTLPSNGVISAELRQHYLTLHARSHRILRVLRTIKRWSGPIGRALPAPLRSQLRRFL
ncbi:MAG: PHP domain-containing protein [Gemmatimonadaceae bacterium]